MVSVDHTNTIAVQGAAPKRIMPAIYCPAVPGSMKGAKISSKNRRPSAAMVNGLISQLTVSVITSPLGRSWMRASDEKSTATIIG